MTYDFCDDLRLLQLIKNDAVSVHLCKVHKGLDDKFLLSYNYESRDVW